MNTEKKINPKAEAKKIARKEARTRIVTFLNDNKDQLGTIADDVRLFIGGGGHRVGVTKSVNNDIRIAFLKAHGEGKGLTELDLFKQFKVGRPEMVTKCRILVLCPNPADRVWVKFDETTETYTVVGLGENPPVGWTGYVPSAKALGL